VRSNQLSYSSGGADTLPDTIDIPCSYMVLFAQLLLKVVVNDIKDINQIVLKVVFKRDKEVDSGIYIDIYQFRIRHIGYLHIINDFN